MENPPVFEMSPLCSVSEISRLRDHVRKLYLNMKRNLIQDYMEKILVVFSLVDVYNCIPYDMVWVAVVSSRAVLVLAVAPARCCLLSSSLIIELRSQHPHPSQETNAKPFPLHWIALNRDLMHA